MTERVHLGISPCPNDTFAFHALLEGRVDPRGLAFTIELQDIEELNQRLLAGEFDVAKASFHTALDLAGETVVLPTGSALGFGVGPLLLAARPGTDPCRPGPEPSRRWRILCPGARTTATLLFSMFYPAAGIVEQVRFSEIMPALAAGRADFGVCIHEGRFTWREHGLHALADLGTLWELRTGCPLPLGGLLARRRLGDDRLRRIQAVIRDSLAYGLAHRGETRPTMVRHAQELALEVIEAHVDLYVNEWTLDLGPVGRQALEVFARIAGEAAGGAGSGPELEVLDGRGVPGSPQRAR